APLIGALIWWLSAQIILWLSRGWMEVSTGSVTALIGAPRLLWLLPRIKSMSAPDMNASDRGAAERRLVLAFAVGGVVLMLLATWGGLSFGREAHGWWWESGKL
ncbi:Fe(3+)-hydroxamate ABC transporter permease FhuB, partial [Salmonella enterica subsp. enterica serovar Kentucky]